MNALPNIASFILCAIISSSVFAVSTFMEIERLWQQSKDKVEYIEYQKEFVQYNNSLRLDTKDGCFNLAPGKIEMYLVISEKAVVESVTTNVKNAKAECFKRTYTGLPVKPPPFSPLVIKMVMEQRVGPTSKASSDE